MKRKRLQELSNQYNQQKPIDYDNDDMRECLAEIKTLRSQLELIMLHYFDWDMPNADYEAELTRNLIGIDKFGDPIEENDHGA